jgi:hypothetical protein
MDHYRGGLAAIGVGGVRWLSGNHQGSRCMGSMYTALLGDRHWARTCGDENGSLRETCNDFGVRGGMERAVVWEPARDLAGVGLHLAGVIDGHWRRKAAMDHYRAGLAAIGGGGVRWLSGNHQGSLCIGRATVGFRPPVRSLGPRQPWSQDHLGQSRILIPREGPFCICSTCDGARGNKPTSAVTPPTNPPPPVAVDRSMSNSHTIPGRRDRTAK